MTTVHKKLVAIQRPCDKRLRRLLGKDLAIFQKFLDKLNIPFPERALLYTTLQDVYKHGPYKNDICRYDKASPNSQKVFFRLFDHGLKNRFPEAELVGKYLLIYCKKKLELGQRKDSHLDWALATAIKAKNETLCRLTLKAGANLPTKMCKIKAMKLALDNGYTALADRLVEMDVAIEGGDRLIACTHQPNTISWLVSKGFSPDTRDIKGLTNLMKQAVEKRGVPDSDKRACQCIQRLLRAGANPDIRSRRGYTAIRMAAVAGYVSRVRLLMFNASTIYLQRSGVQKRTDKMWSTIKEALENNDSVTEIKGEAGEIPSDIRMLLDRNKRIQKRIVIGLLGHWIVNEARLPLELIDKIGESLTLQDLRVIRLVHRATGIFAASDRSVTELCAKR